MEEKPPASVAARLGGQTMTEPGPITWALDLLQAHGIPPLAEGEDERRLLGELLSLGWEVSWTEAPLPRPADETPYQRCLRNVEHAPPANHALLRQQCERLKTPDDTDQYEVRGKAKWLPVGIVRWEVTGESLAEAAMFGLAMALDLQKG